MDDSGVNTEVSAVYSNVENGQGYIVEAVVPGDTFDVGDSVLAEISHQSEKYGSVVSMSAIHADVSGSYVLVERPKDTLLGTEYVAEKVYVTVGDTNNYDAGLKKSPFTGDDKIIVSSDKKVEAGDTVRENRWLCMRKFVIGIFVGIALLWLFIWNVVNEIYMSGGYGVDRNYAFVTTGQTMYTRMKDEDYVKGTYRIYPGETVGGDAVYKRCSQI